MTRQPSIVCSRAKIKFFFDKKKKKKKEVFKKLKSLSFWGFFWKWGKGEGEI